MPSCPRLPGPMLRQNLEANLVTPQIWWLCRWMYNALWMAPLFLSFLHTQLLVLLESMFLHSFPPITVACFLTLIFSLPLYSFWVLRFAKSQSFSFTLVVLDVQPCKFWRPLLQSFPSFLLLPQGTPDIVRPPSSHSFYSSWPLPWDLWVFCIVLPWNSFCVPSLQYPFNNVN